MFRFRTIMAYPCSHNPEDDGDAGYAPRINYFSNPDVSFGGLPTGTATENNAQKLRDNMVSLRAERIPSRTAAEIDYIPAAVGWLPAYIRETRRLRPNVSQCVFETLSVGSTRPS